MTLTTRDLQVEDEIRITGTDDSGRRRVAFYAMVATLSADGSVKVWHMTKDDPRLTADERHIGKFWFEPHNIESIELVRKE